MLHQRRRRRKCSGGAHTLHRPAWPPLCISPDGVVSGHRAARRVRSPRGSCGAALPSELISACVRESEANYSFPSCSYWRVSVYILIAPAAIVIIEAPTRGNANTELARRVCDFRSSAGDRRGEERGRGRRRKDFFSFLFFSFLFFSFLFFCVPRRSASLFAGGHGAAEESRGCHSPTGTACTQRLSALFLSTWVLARALARASIHRVCSPVPRIADSVRVGCGMSGAASTEGGGVRERVRLEDTQRVPLTAAFCVVSSEEEEE